jgi:hypothetical protein
VPVPLKVTTVRSQKDLKPIISTFRSFSKLSPFDSPSCGVTPGVSGFWHEQACTRTIGTGLQHNTRN